RPLHFAERPPMQKMIESSPFVSRARRLALVAAWVASGAGCQDYRVCSPPDPARLALAPALLSQTGLFADVATDAIAPDVHSFRPEFELWSDGATKRRWILLPAGAQIDTSDMDAWRLPEGTRLWKEFTRDGVRVETRLLERVGPRDDDWLMVA